MLCSLSQPPVCEWLKRLTPLVSAVLGRALLLPTRRPVDLDTLLEAVPALRLLLLDGAERPSRRPKDKPRKKDDHNNEDDHRGKKKAHRQKNRLVSSHARRVVCLGTTRPGRVHDKQLADGSGLRLPADARVVKGPGFQGGAPPDGPTLPHPPRSRVDESFTVGRKPSTKSCAKCAWAWNTPSAGSSVAASWPTPSATCVRASWTRRWNRPAACTTCA